MKTIVLFPALELPLPAVKGGAIETLIDILVSENEKHGEFKLYIVSIYDEMAFQLSKVYRNTKFIYIKDKKCDYLYMFVYKVLRRLFNIRPIYLNKKYNRAFDELKKITPDYIICEGGYYNDFKNISNFFGKNKLILHIHHDYEPNNKVASYFSNFIGISNFIVQKWKENYLGENQRIHLLRNCIDLEKFNKYIDKKEEIRKQVRFRHGIDLTDFVFIYVGRIVEEKGLSQLIQAFKILCTEKDKVRLLIIGGYDSKSNKRVKYFKKFISSINGTNSIKYLGYIHNDEIYKYYYSADAAVFPSTCEEAAGLVTIEAMACGVPVIATKSGGMNEYAIEQYAIAVNKDEKLVSELLIEMRKLYDREVKLKKASDYVKAFGKEKYYEHFRKVIKEIDAQ